MAVMIRKLVLMVFMSAASLPCCAQVYFSNIKTFDERDGFTITEGAANVIQDKKGYIWISTRSGLYRFNGTSFKLFKHSIEDSFSLPANTVNFCYQDKDGDYWVGISGKGLYRYNEATDKFYPWKNRNSGDIDMTHLYNIMAPFEDSRGQLWFSVTTKGIIKINKKEKTVQFFDVCDKEEMVDVYRSCKWVHHIIEGATGWLWLASNDGLIHFNTEKGGFQIYRNGKELTCLINDGTDKLWIGTWGEGLKFFDAVTGTWKTYQWNQKIAGNTNIVAGIVNKDKNNLWVSTLDQGLLIFNKISKQFTQVLSPYENGSLLTNTFNITGDKSNNLWIIGQHQLTRISNKNVFQFEPMVSETSLVPMLTNCFLHSANDSLLFVGAVYTKNGLRVYNMKNRSIRIIDLPGYQGDQNIQDLFEDSRKQIWIATDHGIYLLNRAQLNAYPFAVPKAYQRLFAGSFSKIVEDRKSRLWFASRWQGIICYDPAAKSLIHYNSDSSAQQHIPFNQIEYLLADDDNNIWVGTHAYLEEQSPLFCITATGPVIDYKGKIPIEAVLQLSKTKDKEIVVSTAQAGVFRIAHPLEKTEAIKHYSEDNGITNAFVEGAIEDSKGDLWITTHNGLSCQTKTGFINFFSNDGLVRNNIPGRPYADANNTIFLPFENGFQFFQADTLLSFHEAIGPVMLESIAVNQQTLPGNPGIIRQLYLPYSQNNLSFRFSAFDLSQGDKLHYSYQLEGSDTSWNDLGSNQQLFFSNLAHGHYKLKLKAGDRFGNWSRESLNLSIIIKPPFWQTWWFYSLCGISLVAVAFGIYKIRVRRIMAEQKLRNKIARDLHDDIGSTLSGIKLFSNMAENKLVQERSAATSIVQRIGERSEKMIEAMSDIVWSINPANDTLENMLVKMKQYAAEMLEPKNIVYQFRTDERVTRLKIGLEVRKDIYLVFKEGINNAVKHSGCKNLWIDLKLEKKSFAMAVEDDGIGIRNGDDQGNGLNNFRQRAKNVGGSIEIKSAEGKGTRIKLVVPLT